MTPRPVTLAHRPVSRGGIAAFLLLGVLLYAVAASIAETVVGRAGDGPFQTLLARSGTQVDVAVVGASHALPLLYGDVPERLARETDTTMVVLAEVGAGPLFGIAVVRQALRDMPPRRVLYVLDDFAFFSEAWNERRLEDRDMLRRMPWRASTARILAGMVAAWGVSPIALADYLAAFSKLNAPDLFPPPGWAGAAGFDGAFRPSRHAIEARLAYLYPEGAAPGPAAGYLDMLETMTLEVRAAGATLEILRLPVSAPFRDALPVSPAFDAALAARLATLDLPVHDLRDAVTGAEMFFDTDHLNRAGVAALYDAGLKARLAGPTRAK